MENTGSSTKVSGNDSKSAKVVGLYGLPGCGKTYLLEQLKMELGLDDFAYFEGSEVINAQVPGGMEAFRAMSEEKKSAWRKNAIDEIGSQCAVTGKMGIVTGHYMFWANEQEDGLAVWNQRDAETYTHIVYLDIQPKTLTTQREADSMRRRRKLPTSQLAKWQSIEKERLTTVCRDNGILFSVLKTKHSLKDTVTTMLRDFKIHDEAYNSSQAKMKLDEALAPHVSDLKTVLIFDGDRTLAPQDTGKLFWIKVPGTVPGKRPLDEIFGGPMGYSYTAFRQVTLMYEEHIRDREFDAYCQKIASEVHLYPELLSLLQKAAAHDNVTAVVVTCGLRLVWEKVLERKKLSRAVKVIGGGRISDGYVVTPKVKGELVEHLRDDCGQRVVTFGDSSLDLKMLIEADEAIVVVGDQNTRSKTMDEALENAITGEGLKASQALLPNTVTPRLDTIRLPLINLTAPSTLDAILNYDVTRDGEIELHEATNKGSAKLLTTSMRDASLSGPRLREAHRRVGHYLAIEYLPDLIGLEEYDIKHVQGDSTNGHRLMYEEKTTIVALMRGGEPMAFGVSDTLPLAPFVHASCTQDIQLHHLEGQLNVILVDSVINTGETIIEFVKHVRSLHPKILIVVVAGVVQEKFFLHRKLQRALGKTDNLKFVILRQSANEYTGKGKTDTGNRLFCSTHLL